MEDRPCSWAILHRNSFPHCHVPRRQTRGQRTRLRRDASRPSGCSAVESFSGGRGGRLFKEAPPNDTCLRDDATRFRDHFRFGGHFENCPPTPLKNFHFAMEDRPCTWAVLHRNSFPHCSCSAPADPWSADPPTPRAGQANGLAVKSSKGGLGASFKKPPGSHSCAQQARIRNLRDQPRLSASHSLKEASGFAFSTSDFWTHARRAVATANSNRPTAASRWASVDRQRIAPSSSPLRA